MPSIKYSEVYSRFFTKVEAYDLFADGLTNKQRNEMLRNWLSSAVYNPYIFKLFSSINMKDDEKPDDNEYYVDENGNIIDNSPEIEDGTITYSMEYVVSEGADRNFVIEVLAYGVGLGWIDPKVNSIMNTMQLLTDSDKRFFSQQAHLEGLRNLRSEFDIKIHDLIRDRGYAFNSYLDGEGSLTSSS